jgi:eukaryotic-like serine/threonine-protein kinase
MDIPVQPGQLIAERYVVERVLGAGGMGVVVSAVHRTLGERVAIKFLLEHSTAEPRVVERFLREARAAARLQSEHIARVTDVGTLESGAPYMIMEFLDGNDAATEIAERGALPIAEAIDYVLQACEALAEAHSIGIVHRDLKPGNLFLASRPGGFRVVKVIDFGIAKSSEAVTSLTTTSSTMGSPKYMSPEQIRDSKSVDQRSDVWSMGVTCFELLTGEVPFQSDSLHGTLAGIVSDAPIALRKIRPDAPAELEAALAPCFEKNRDQRYESIAEFARAIAPFGDARAAQYLHKIESVLGVGPSRPRPAQATPIRQSTPTKVVAPGLTVSGAMPTDGYTRTSFMSRNRAGKLVVGFALVAALGGASWLLARDSSQPVAREGSSATMPSVTAIAPSPPEPSDSNVPASAAAAEPSVPTATSARPNLPKRLPPKPLASAKPAASSGPLTIEGRKF